MLLLLANLLNTTRKDSCGSGASGVQTFSYGNMGELIENIHTFVVPNGNPYTFKMVWNYDSWNRTKAIIYPDNEKVNYKYNSAGKLIALFGSKGNDVYKYVDSINYNKFGNRDRIKYGNGTITDYTYNTVTRRLSNLKSYDAQGSIMQNIDYTYNNSGDILSQRNTTNAISGLGGTYYFQYNYDSLKRLVSSNGTTAFGASYSTSMGYSSSGNILSKTMNATSILNGNTLGVNYSNTYSYNTSQPHTVANINDNNNYTHYMTWDANGNMTNLNNTATGINRSMCWDEENRLTMVTDNQSHLSHYIYNAGGERVWKLSGPIERMTINGHDYIDQAMLSKTLYESPYMVLTDKEYTKHYYIESQRVTTKLGGGMTNNLVDPYTSTLSPIEGTIEEIANNLYENMVNTSCAQDIQIVLDKHFKGVDLFSEMDDKENELYYYHGDHLGSSSWITDINGNVNQFLGYLPFGEALVDQRATGHDIRFKFTGKERDSETGFDYFGARYYDSDLSVWLSVDPILKANESPYLYCAGNPIMLVDLDGRDHWKIGDDGKATLQDTKGRHVYVNGEKLSKHDFTGHEEAASTITTHYYNKHFSKNKYHLANGKISIASFKDGEFDRKSSYNLDENYTPDETSYAATMPGKGNSDGKNRINLFLVDGHMNPEFDNKYNLINCLSHERVHLIQGATSSSIRNELQAYYKMMTHWSWNKTDGRFRIDMEGNVNDYISNLWEWGYFRGGVTQAQKKYSQRLYHYYSKLFSPLMNVRKPN